MALTAERKLTRVVIDLMRNPLFADMSGIFMMGTKEVSDDVPTAATNGRDEVYGRAFIDGLSIPEVAFVVVHESFHKMYRHLTTWHKLWLEDPQLTNMACDYVINLEIVTRDPSGTVVAMPQKDGKPIGLIDQRFKGMNTKQVFDILKKEKEEGGKVAEAVVKCRGEGIDQHDWEGASDLTKEEKEELV
jgi:predicted metal-dependent peptidase